MTQRVRPVVRRHRRGMVACVIVALAAGLVFAVLPAGSTGGASAQGVVPRIVTIGEHSGVCAAVSSTAMKEFKVTNPKTKSYTDPATGVTFKLTVKNDETTVEFIVTGAAVEDVVIKGGSKWAHYDYLAGGPRAPVTWDKNLHAPPKYSSYYEASVVSFCYSIGGTIAGDVWQDSNENQAKDGFESFQPNWKINLYTAGSTTPYRSATTNASGHYEFTLVPLGRQYTVCETKPVGDSTTWAQTTPITVVCTGLGSNEERGHQFTPTADALDKNFGNVHTVTLDCNTQSEPVSTQNGNYTVQLAGAGFCTKEGSHEYVFESYTDPNQVASFHPQGTATGQASVVERLIWDIGNTQSAVLRYDDDVTNGIQLRDMLYCNLDPRVSGSDFTLATNVGVLPETHTSCLITSTEQAGGTRVDFVYSSVDGYRTVG
jgi:hypothetical protein